MGHCSLPLDGIVFVGSDGYETNLTRLQFN